MKGVGRSVGEGCYRELASYDPRIVREDQAMLKLWGRISLINVRKVVLTAQLLEVPFERIDARVRPPGSRRRRSTSISTPMRW